MTMPWPVPNGPEWRIIQVVSDDTAHTINAEQRQRLVNWLSANGLDPKQVALKAISVETEWRGGEPGRSLIRFWQHYTDPSGAKLINERTRGPLLVERWVQQQVPLAPEPSPDGAEEDVRLPSTLSTSDALMREYHRRRTHIEARTDYTPLASAQVQGELIGLRGALGIALKGQVRGDEADRIAMQEYDRWLGGAEADKAACACALCTAPKESEDDE